jgi:hypothetical protein
VVEGTQQVAASWTRKGWVGRPPWAWHAWPLSQAPAVGVRVEPAAKHFVAQHECAVVAAEAITQDEGHRVEELEADAAVPAPGKTRGAAGVRLRAEVAGMVAGMPSPAR